MTISFNTLIWFEERWGLWSNHLSVPSVPLCCIFFRDKWVISRCFSRIRKTITSFSVIYPNFLSCVFLHVAHSVTPPPCQTNNTYHFKERFLLQATMVSPLSLSPPFRGLVLQNFNLPLTPLRSAPLLSFPVLPLRPWTVMPGVFKKEAEDFPQSFNLGLLQSGTTLNTHPAAKPGFIMA